MPRRITISLALFFRSCQELGDGVVVVVVFGEVEATGETLLLRAADGVGLSDCFCFSLGGVGLEKCFWPLSVSSFRASMGFAAAGTGACAASKCEVL